MKASATLRRRRESIGRAACGIVSVMVLLVLVVVTVAWTLHHHRHHRRLLGIIYGASAAAAAITREQQQHERDARSCEHYSAKMSGEMGNHLSKLASGVGIALAFLRNTHGFPSNLTIATPRWSWYGKSSGTACCISILVSPLPTLSLSFCNTSQVFGRNVPKRA
jgi:hypothetical protein